MASTDILESVEPVAISNATTPDHIREMLQTMVRIRRFEIRTIELFHEGRIAVLLSRLRVGPCAVFNPRCAVHCHVTVAGV